jgi:hypothetical protein
MISTPGLSAQTKEYAIVELESANASLDMKVLLASAQSALTTVTIVELAGQRST